MTPEPLKYKGTLGRLPHSERPTGPYQIFGRRQPGPMIRVHRVGLLILRRLVVAGRMLAAPLLEVPTWLIANVPVVNFILH